ncbi:sensor histidine kinase [Cellulomonas massiliensis]|uniref:sensor histidine kinase n=1 Tax=Cellulomonas massiliensis TaxID=1465811 RepID=UPI0002DB1DC2|nr:HAMP domain-containing sensor histidine kinase [Cellulomonas massiliensis]
MSADEAQPPATGTRVRPSSSLRVRLTLGATAVVAVALAAGALALTAVLQAGRVAALDEVVRARVATVASLVASDSVPSTLGVGQPGEIAQVLDADGRVLATSPTASRTLPLLDAPTAERLRAGGGVDVSTTATGYDPAARVAVRATTYRGQPVTIVASVPLQEVRGVVRALRVALVGVVPVVSAIVGLLVWVSLGRALRPVEELRRAAADVALEGGTRSLPVPAADDEIGALARTLDAMLARLRSAAERQQTFVADAAHELRSPLAALRATVEVAASHPGSTTTAELAADLEPEIVRMQALVDDLLLLARLGAHPLDRTEVDLLALTRRVVASIPPDTRGAVDVTVTGTGRVRADDAATTRVLRNLVENAVRHARTRVEVAVTDGAVTVDDDGSGIGPGERDVVFERFVRLDEARERDAGGSGLGLAIARELAREMQGDVTLDGAPAGGLRAVLRLPA